MELQVGDAEAIVDSLDICITENLDVVTAPEHLVQALGNLVCTCVGAGVKLIIFGVRDEQAQNGQGAYLADIVFEHSDVLDASIDVDVVRIELRTIRIDMLHATVGVVQGSKYVLVLGQGIADELCGLTNGLTAEERA